MMKSWQNSNSFEPEVLDPVEPLCSGPGPYRPNAAALILKSQGSEILLGERTDTPGRWQWPQGGLEPEETPEDGLFRELQEEIGVSKARILYRFPFKLIYRFPQRLSNKFKPCVGQEQVYFVVEIDQAPNLEASDGEFSAVKWTPLEHAMDHVVWHKAPLYKAVLEHLHLAIPQIYPTS